MILARLDPQGNVLDFMDWRDSDAPPQNSRPATVDEIAALAVSQPIAPTPRAWLERLAPATQAAIAAAGAANPAIFLWLLKAAGTPLIDVTAAETIQGVGALVTAGIITAQDQATLLAP